MSGRHASIESRSGNACKFTSRELFIHTTLLAGLRAPDVVSDFVREALKLSKTLKDRQIVWTRTDDMNGGWVPAAVDE